MDWGSPPQVECPALLYPPYVTPPPSDFDRRGSGRVHRLAHLGRRWKAQGANRAGRERANRNQQRAHLRGGMPRGDLRCPVRCRLSARPSAQSPIRRHQSLEAALPSVSEQSCLNAQLARKVGERQRQVVDRIRRRFSLDSLSEQFRGALPALHQSPEARLQLP